MLIAPLALLLAAPAVAQASALTSRGPVADDTPRAAWLERYVEARQGPESTDRVTKSFKVGRDGALDLTGISGDIKVTGGQTDEIRIEATKRVRHRDATEAKRILDELRVDATSLNGRVEVRSIYPRRPGGGGDRNVSASIDYVVTVPSTARVALRNISGDIEVASVSGEVRVETVSGDVDVTGATALAQAKTVSGDVTVRDSGGEGLMTLGTVSGSIRATGLRARTLECGSVSGDVTVSGGEVGRAEAKSVSGDIDFNAPLAKGGRYEFTSHSGDVRIVVGEGTGFELDADTFAGTVRSDLPVTLRGTQPNGGDRRGRTPRAIRGTHGDGGAILSVRSFSGDVAIVRR